MAPSVLQEMLHEPFGSCPLCLSSAAPSSWCRACAVPSSLARVPWPGQGSLSCLPPSIPIAAMASCWEALAGPAPLLQPPGSACPSPSGRSAMRQQSSGRSRRRGQRSGSSGGPGLGPCTTAPLHTRTVSARLGTGTWDPVALTAVRAAGHLSANPQTQLSPTWWGHAAITLGCAGD